MERDEVTIPTSLVRVRLPEGQQITPAMRAVLWVLADAVDAERITSRENAEWVTVETKKLRLGSKRNDNFHLRETLQKLTALSVSGEAGDDAWGAVILAEYRFIEKGSRVRLLVPPSALAVLSSPKTFAKIEARAVHSLGGHARQLYLVLADKKRQQRPYWTFSLDELRELLNVDDKASYKVWQQFKRWVLEPAVAEINDFGTVSVTATPEKAGRSIVAVRFDWCWKDPHVAEETAAENERHSKARRKKQDGCEAPPLIEDEQVAADAPKHELSVEERWWAKLSEDERDRLTKKHREASIEMPGGKTQTFQRQPADIVRAAFKDRDRTSR